jgi:hypothetical protein
MFCVYVASMCGNTKTNIELIFSAPPSIAQVTRRATAAFQRLAEIRGIHMEFAVSFAMIFDDYESRWVPLERSSQLVHNAQVYYFQPDVLDLPGEIPDPVSAVQFMGEDYYNISPGTSRRGSVSPGGRAADTSDYVSPYRAAQESPRAAVPASYTPRRDFNYPAVDEFHKDVERRHREAAKLGDIPGASIIQQERESEERKARLPVDLYRETVRRETQAFLEWSPSRSPSRQP